MNDVIQDIRDYFADRFSSPFWISFIVTWLVINWELPITAIFETDKFSVTFISEYLAKTQSWYKWQLPTLLAITYAIFSSSVKEIIDILSKLIRSIFSYVDRKGKLYRSISLIEHEKEIARLERRLQKENTSKEQLTEYSLENKKLEEEIKSLQLELKNREDYREHNSKLTVEIENLKKDMELSTEKIDESINSYNFNETVEEEKIESTYLGRLKKYCNNQTMELLNDPNSRTSLLLLLEFYKDKLPYSLKQTIKASGIPIENWNKTLSISIEAGLLNREKDVIDITDRGKIKIKELRKEKLNNQLLNAIDRINTDTKHEILSILERRSMMLNELADSIKFNQNFLKILQYLILENSIHKEGNVYFYGPSA